MLEKIGSFVGITLSIIGAGIWISVLLGLTIHLIRFAWGAF